MVIKEIILFRIVYAYLDILIMMLLIVNHVILFVWNVFLVLIIAQYAKVKIELHLNVNALKAGMMLMEYIAHV